MKYKKNVLLLLFLAFICLPVWSRKVTGTVLSKEDGTPIAAAYVTLFRNDSISGMSQSDASGKFTFEMADGKPSTLSATALGYQDMEVTFLSDTVTRPISIMLPEASVSKDLSEVVVTADRSHVVKRTANGQVFFLSDKAKKERNPFMALMEIPLLMTDPSLSTVKLLDGKQPLVLIDGNQVNSGISPILPEDIESVEVITSVPARYLQEGYNGIVNIRLKKNRRPYIWFGLHYSKNFPSAQNSGPSANFEVGNEKFSIYGAGIYYYTQGAKTMTDVNRLNTGYRQTFSSVAHKSSNAWYGWLLLKYKPTDRDYLAGSIRNSYNKTKTHSTAEGEYIQDETERYLSEGFDKDRGNVFSANLYYKHAFADYNDLELTAAYNTNANRLNSSNNETIGTDTEEYLSRFHNERHSGSIKADYSKTFTNGMSMAFGDHIILNSDRIDQRIPSSPLFRHKRVNEYAYGSFGGSAGKLSYNLSAGLEAIWLKAGDVSDDYIRPRANLSATWSYSGRNSTKLSYTLTNETPSIALLNPYNTSTDPLIVNSGNPLLKPMTMHNVSMSHTFNSNGWYVTPSVDYCHYRDMPTEWGYTQGDVYHSTYRNAGHYSEMEYFLNLSYNSSWLTLTTFSGWTDRYFRGQRAKGAFRTYISVFTRVKKLYFIVELNYKTRDYTEISVTRHRNPLQSRIHVSYNFTPDFYIAVGMYNYTGNVRSVTDLHQGTFMSRTTTVDRGEGRGFTPYVTIYYNFRKNSKRKIKFFNPMFEEEEGISLKK